MPEPESILVIEPDDSIRDLLKDYFDGLGYKVSPAAGISEGLEIVSDGGVSVVVMDTNSSPDQILEAVDNFRRVRPGLHIILITGCPTLQSIIDALRHGVFDIVVKPFRLADLQGIISRALIPSTEAAASDRLLDRIRQLENALHEHGLPVPDPEYTSVNHS